MQPETAAPRGRRTWRYAAVPEARDGPGAERERVYGLRATVRFPNGWELIELIHGVTPSGEITELLAAVFTRRQIPPDYAREFVGELL